MSGIKRRFEVQVRRDLKSRRFLVWDDVEREVVAGCHVRAYAEVIASMMEDRFGAHEKLPRTRRRWDLMEPGIS